MCNTKCVSVIIPIYGVEEYLSNCIQSIVEQSYSNLEIILVDDGSPDSCPQMCDEWAVKDARIRVVHQKNGGAGIARNSGLRVATGDYVTFVDGDDTIDPQMYEHMVRCLEEQQCDIVTCGRMNVMEDGKRIPVFTLDKPISMNKTEAFRRLLVYNAIDSSSCDKLYRRELFEGIEFPGDYICEDVDVVYRLIDKAEKGLYHCGEPFYYYYQRSGSRSRGVYSEKTKGIEIFHKEVYEYVRNHYPEMEREAEYFYISRLPLIIDILVNSIGGESYGKEISGKMRKLLIKAIKNPYMSTREKEKYIMISLGIYTPIRKLYVRIKGY